MTTIEQIRAESKGSVFADSLSDHYKADLDRIRQAMGDPHGAFSDTVQELQRAMFRMDDLLAIARMDGDRRTVRNIQVRLTMAVQYLADVRDSAERALD